MLPWPVAIRRFQISAKNCQSAFNGDPLSSSNCDPLPGGGTGGEAPPPGQPAGTIHPNPFHADHPWLPFLRCPMRRSCYSQRAGSNSDAESPLHGSSLHAFQHALPRGKNDPTTICCIYSTTTAGQSISPELTVRINSPFRCIFATNSTLPPAPRAECPPTIGNRLRALKPAINRSMSRSL